MTTATAPSSTGIQFNGTSDYVDCGAILTNTYTKEVWFEFDSTVSHWNKNIVSGARHALWISGKKVRAAHSGNWDSDVIDANEAPSGKQYYAVTYDSASKVMKLYKNGALINTATNVAPMSISSQADRAVYLGKYSGGNYFKGKIYEVRIWNDVRSDAEISANWNKALTGEEQGLIAYYQLNQADVKNNTATIIDQSDARNNADLNQAQDQSKSKSLAVSLIGQKTGLWCWAASKQMAMKFLGNDVSQCEMANNNTERTDCCNDPTPSDCVKGGWPYVNDHGFTCTRGDWEAALTFEQLKAQIDAGKPITFCWGWIPRGGHSMVVTGYYEDSVGNQLVYINDPWPVNAGDHKTVTYQDWVAKEGDHTHQYDYYDITYVGTSNSDAVSNDATAPQGGTSGMKPLPTFDDPADAAKNALSLIPALVNEENYANFGLRSNISSAESLSLEPPIPIQYIRANDLDQFEIGNDVREIIGAPEELLYPVSQEGTVVTSIVVARQPDGSSAFRSIGSKNLVNAVHEVYSVSRDNTGKEHEAYFLVHIPHVEHLFLAHFEGDTLLLTTIFDIVDQGIPPHETFEANELLHILADTIFGHPGALGERE